MQLVDLFEDAEADIHASIVGDTVRRAVLSYLYRHRDEDNFRFAVCVYQGKDRECLPISDVAPDLPEFSDVLLLFKPTEYGMGGRMTSLQSPRAGFKYLVEIDVMGTSIQDVIRAIQAKYAANIFRHEFQHVLDAKRYKGDMFAGLTKGQKKDNLNDGPSSYHNNPAELNAYFHNIAEDLLALLRLHRQYGPEAAVLMDRNIEPDFRKYIETLPAKFDSSMRRHWKYISPRNKQRLLSRLRALHAKYFSLADEPK